MSTDQLPTETELSILKILWDQGPSTVHEVLDALPQDSGYTTVLKFLQIMHEKGIVDREKDGRAHRYWSLLDKEETQQKMLGEFTNRLFDGSMQQLMQRAVSSDKLNRDDLDELQKLLQELKSAQGDSDND
jgi:predicted transcriptional regulator